MADAKARLSLALGLLLAGCAGGERPAWFYKTAAESGLPGPVAVWGAPASSGDAGFSCEAPGRISFWLAGEAPISTGQPLLFRAGKAEAALTERFEEDGLGMSLFAIPPGSPLLAALGGAARSLAWRDTSGRWFRLKLGPEVPQLIGACE